MTRNESSKNKLYFGDNLTILREHVPDGSIDLVYLDPPFNSKATYNVLFGERNGTQPQAQITAFEDTWHWGAESEATFTEVVTKPGSLSDLFEMLRGFLGTNDMMAYLVMMAPRLVGLHRSLKSTGSLYLHCDPTASHYLKLILDAIFGVENFRNEIVWQRSGAHNFPTKGYVRTSDIILFYTKSNDFLFNQLYTEYGAEQLSRFKPDENGRLYKAENLTFSTTNKTRQFEWRGTRPPANRSWGASLEQLETWWGEGRILKRRDGSPRLDGLKIYLEDTKGKPLTTNWTDIPRIGNTAAERLGYPTQKPEALLERIISASSNEGDLVLDPFCGCGTTVAVAERLKRKWMGIDITYLAIALVRSRLESAFLEETNQIFDAEKGKFVTVIHTADYEVIGDLRDLSGAKALSEQDRDAFETWIVGKLGGRPSREKKKGADSGIDGRLKFFDDASGKSKTVIIQAKSGHVGVSQVRDLIGVMKRERASIGVFVTLAPPTKPMILEAVAEGHYAPPDIGGHPTLERKVPRLQILTVKDVMDGATIRLPPVVSTTFKKAERKYKENGPEQEELL